MKQKVFFVCMAVCVFHMAAAGQELYAVLESGPVFQTGVDVLPKVSLPSLFGTYRIVSGGSGKVSVWALSDSLPYQNGQWRTVAVSRNTECFRYADSSVFSARISVPNMNVEMENYAGWTFVFEFRPDGDDPVSEAAAAVFIGLFEDRFSYFASLVRFPQDISFPAVLSGG